MPNDSPPSDGAHRTSAATSRRTFSASGTTPSQMMSGDSGWSRRSASVRGPSPAIQSTGRRAPPSAGHRPSVAEPLEGIEEDGQALAFLVAPEEEDGRPVGRPRVDLPVAVDLDAVEPHLVGPAQRVAMPSTGPTPTPRTRTANRRARWRATGPSTV